MTTSLFYTKLATWIAAIGLLAGIALALIGGFGFLGETGRVYVNTTAVMYASITFSAGVSLIVSSVLIGVLTDISISVAKPKEAKATALPGSEEETDPAFKYIKRK